MLPDCILEEVGIREGEKLHEVMIPKDESRMTFEYEKHYIIYPHFDWWNSEKFFTNGGRVIEEGYEYNSGTNSEWLGVNELKQKVQALMF